MDEELSCSDCSGPFTFTAERQEYFVEKGFTNKPLRCEPCQRAKKDRMNQRNDRGGGGFGDRGGSYGGRGVGGGGAGVCFSFQRTATCDRGAGCRFTHGEGGGGGGGGGGGWRGGGGFGGDRGGGGGGRGVCFAFQRGECNRGGACRFSHST